MREPLQVVSFKMFWANLGDPEVTVPLQYAATAMFNYAKGSRSFPVLPNKSNIYVPKQDRTAKTHPRVSDVPRQTSVRLWCTAVWTMFFLNNHLKAKIQSFNNSLLCNIKSRRGQLSNNPQLTSLIIFLSKVFEILHIWWRPGLFQFPCDLQWCNIQLF